MLPPPYQCVLSIKLKQIQIQIWLKRSMCVDSHSQNCLINTNIETNINNNQQIVSVVSKEYVHIKNTNVSWSIDQYNNNRLKNTKYNPGLFCLVLGTAGDKTKVMTKLQIMESAWGAGVKAWRVKICNHNFERFLFWFLDQELDLLWWAFTIIWSRIKWSLVQLWVSIVKFVV